MTKLNALELKIEAFWCKKRGVSVKIKGLY